jgi:hypothetical protein
MMNRIFFVSLATAALVLSACGKSEESAEGQAAPATGTVEQPASTTAAPAGEQGGSTAQPASE